MKKIISKLVMGIVFVMFGFVIVTQLNTVTNKSADATDNSKSSDILLENEQLKTEKKELEKKIDELNNKSLKYELDAAGSTGESKAMFEELQSTRLKAGLTDVEGQGIIVYINPKTTLSSNQTAVYPTEAVEDSQLLILVNELYSAGAEAVSINEIRLVGSSGIRTAGNSIIINNERISPLERITIKAIGNKTVLEGAIKFTGAIPKGLEKSWEVKYELKDLIDIKKVKNSINFEYIREVKEN